MLVTTPVSYLKYQKLIKLTMQASRLSHSNLANMIDVATNVHSDWPQSMHLGLSCLASLVSFYSIVMNLLI